MSEKKIKVSIAGGGISGIALAVGLQRYPHVEVHIYEALDKYPDTGAGMAMHKNAIAAMELIDPDLKKAYLSRANLMASDEEVELATQVILASGIDTGKVVGHLGQAKGRKTISRSDLIDAWLQLLPENQITFGKRLVGVQQQDGKVTLEFQDGTNIESDCLIGAEGIRSATRQYILGANHPATPPQNHDGWYVYSRLVPMDEARQSINEQWTRNVAILCGPRGYMCSLPIHKGKTLSCTFQAPGKLLGDQPESFSSEPYADYSDDAHAIAKVW